MTGRRGSFENTTGFMIYLKSFYFHSRVNHSNNAIVKPPGKKPDTQEISEAMRRVREAQSLISKALEPEKKPEKKESSE